MGRSSTLFLGVVQGALTLFLGMIALIALMFFIGGIHELVSRQQYFQAGFLIVAWLVLAGLVVALGALTIRTLRRWKEMQ